jgi:hypothetical protein
MALPVLVCAETADCKYNCVRNYCGLRPLTPLLESKLCGGQLAGVFIYRTLLHDEPCP